MTATEDRVRAAMDAIAGQVDTAPPPLPLPPPDTAARRGGRGPRRRWGPWLAPAAAAAAVIAVAVTLVAVRNAPVRRPAAPPAASASGVAKYGVPEYYVMTPVPETLGFAANVAPDAVVGDTLTGTKVATVPAPKGWGFAGVTAAGDDRTFVLTAEPGTGSQQVPPRLYLLRLSPGTAPFASLRQLPISPPPGAGTGVAGAMALSPDGSMLAFATGTGPSPAEVLIYSTATGAIQHTWSVSSREKPGIDRWHLVSWTSGGRQLAIEASTPTGPLAIRLLPVDDPGHDLLADSRPLVSLKDRWDSPLSCDGSYRVAGNGTTVVCGSAAQIREPASYTGSKACQGTRLYPKIYRYNLAILQFSTATGKLAGTLYQTSTPCEAGSIAVPEVYWVNDAGTAVLGLVGHESGPTHKLVEQFGLFTKGKFIPLPAPLAETGVAW